MNREDFLALVWAVYDKPRVIGLLSKPPLVRRVFGEVLEVKPDDQARIFRIAEATGRAEFLHLAVNHAVLNGQVEELWFAILRLARVWAENGYVPEWDDEDKVGREVRRLIASLNPDLYEELLMSINPANDLWFADMVDCDAVWSRWIDSLMRRSCLREAFDQLLVAGMGLPSEDPHELRKQWGESAWLAIHEAKDFVGNDRFGWLTYARAKDFPKLVRELWQSHVALGMFQRSYMHHVRLLDRCLVNIRRTGDFRVVTVPVRGLILRGAKLDDVIDYVEMDRLAIPWPPEEVLGHLTETGAKLWHMFQFYHRLQSELPSGRRTFAVNQLFVS